MIQSEPEHGNLGRFERGQVYESVVAGRHRRARVVAIVEYGRTAWLEFSTSKSHPLSSESRACKHGSWPTPKADIRPNAFVASDLTGGGFARL